MTDSTKWRVDYIAGMISDIIPIGDTGEHIYGPNCHCGPMQMTDLSGDHFVHHAFDGREKDELAAASVEKWGTN